MYLPPAIQLMRQPHNVAAVSLLARELEHRKEVESGEIDVIVGVSDGDITEEQWARYRALVAACNTSSGMA
jgi:hypothetical protein